MAIWLMAALLTKHLIVDYPLQPRWMYANKGILGHPGGVAHAVAHQMGTCLILLGFASVRTAVFLSLAECAAHYFIDYAKVNIGKRTGWGPTNSEAFWWLLGLDQWLHHMCYVAIVLVVAP